LLEWLYMPLMAAYRDDFLLKASQAKPGEACRQAKASA
jgi:hypothetical protein